MHLPPFALKQKVEPKVQGGRDRSARPAVPPHNKVSSQAVTCAISTVLLDYIDWIKDLNGNNCMKAPTVQNTAGAVIPPVRTTTLDYSAGGGIKALNFDAPGLLSLL